MTDPFRDEAYIFPEENDALGILENADVPAAIGDQIALLIHRICTERDQARLDLRQVKQMIDNEHRLRREKGPL